MCNIHSKSKIIKTLTSELSKEEIKDKDIITKEITLKGDINKLNEYLNQIRMVSSEIESIIFDFSYENY